MNDLSQKHYPTYLALVMSMIISFLLGIFFVEMPFASGLDYFHGLQEQNLIVKQVRAFQQRNAAQRLELESSDAQRNVAACSIAYDVCRQDYTDAFDLGSITEAAWLVGQAQCARVQSVCVADIAGL